MAMVHPSRMGLVPQDPPKDRSRRSPSPDHRLRDRSRDRSNYGRSRDSGRDSDRKRDDERRGRGRDERRDDRDDERSSRSRDRGHRDDDGGAARPRRASPVYAEYRKPSSPRRRSPEYAEYRKPASPLRDAQASSRQQETMYPPRRERAGDGRHLAVDGRGFGGDGQDYFERRRQQRLSGTLSIWPPSPKAPARALSPERISKKSRKHKRSRSSSVSSTEDSEEERRRREHKERKRARKEKERSERKDRHRHRSTRHRSRTRSEDEEDERERRRSRHKSRTKSREPERRRDTRSISVDIQHDVGEDGWVEKPVTGVLAPEVHKASDVVAVSTSAVAARDVSMEESDEEVGPQPAYKINASKKIDERAYGGALLRGEGSAMAAFLQDGTDMRIPRRGEIGLESDEIASFESVGYVMSGSRHHRMNAVRIRKENQVISAEEKRGILKLQQEERERREAILREEFQELLKEKLKGTEG